MVAELLQWILKWQDLEFLKILWESGSFDNFIARFKKIIALVLQGKGERIKKTVLHVLTLIP